ncbi:MAG: hypothetical protein ACETWR_03950 [Anaerolineae bacterium]
MPSLLLDKNVARKAITALAKARTGVRPTVPEEEMLRMLALSSGGQASLFITPETANILSQREQILAMRLFLDQVEVMRRGRYFQRWTRRLGEHGFTPEDAKVLSYGTFGLTPSGNVMGVSFVATLDQSFINNYRMHRDQLQRRLKAMASQLPLPYRNVLLPPLVQPKELLRQVGWEV